MSVADRPKTWYFHIINVKVHHKHTNREVGAKRYEELFTKIYKQKYHAQSSPGKHCIIRSHFPEKEGQRIIYWEGVLAQFTFISNEKWLNIQSLDIDEEFTVPEGLFPDAVFSEYTYIPSVHRFAFRTSSKIHMSPQPVAKFLESAFSAVCNEVTEYVVVDVEKDRGTIERILQADYLKKLTLKISYSNFDNASDFQRQIEADMKSSNTSQLEIIATQKPDAPIEINNSIILRGALDTSASNGVAEAKVLNAKGETETINTASTPLREKVFGGFYKFHYMVYQKIISLFRNNENNNADSPES